MIYLDTSVIVTLLANEPLYEHVRGWLRGQQAGDLFISDWVVTETSSALSRKVRMGQLTEEARWQSTAEWRRLQAGLTILSVEPSNFLLAAGYCDRPQPALRAGDALHIAVVRAAGCKLATLDRRMAEAARTIGVPVADL